MGWSAKPYSVHQDWGEVVKDTSMLNTDASSTMPFRLSSLLGTPHLYS